MMVSLTTILFLLVFLWLLAGIILFLHSLHPRTGLTPLMMFLGAITGTMQIQGLRAIEITYGNFNFSLDGAVLLPVLLFGLLIVYITNGSVQGRSAALGVMLISLLIIFFQLLLYQLPNLISIEYTFVQTYSLRIIFASIVTLGIDTVVLFLGYQTFSNLRRRYPSRFASGFALGLALLVDAVLFSLLTFWGNSDRVMIIQSQIIQKVVAGLALWPFLSVYIFRMAPRFPDSAATASRPIFDIFTTNLKLESRARYHYNLLRTLSHINLLIARATDPNQLLTQTCEALLALRNYHMVWIGIINQTDQQISQIAHAGFSQEQIQNFITSGKMGTLHPTKISHSATVVNQIANETRMSQKWQKMMTSTGCQAAASFPMRHLNEIFGVLNVCLKQPNSFDELETNLLQELADNLAYALVSLEARSQQALLHTSAETMRDGLLILSLDGEIIYANQEISKMVGISQTELTGKNIESIMLPEQGQTVSSYFEILLDKGALEFDIEFQSRERIHRILSINTSLGRDINGEANHIVANIRDATSQRNYEHQLLTIHRLTTDLVQIHDPNILANMILTASTEVLGANASGIFMIDLDTKQISETLTYNLSKEYSGRIQQDYQGLPGEDVLKTRQPVHINDTLNNPIYGERIHFMAKYDVRALLILPVIIQDTILGALAIYYNQPHNFEVSEIQIGQTLAQTLAIAYQNAQLYQGEQNQRVLAEALAQAAAMINSSLELEQVLDLLLEQAMRVIPCRAANIIMLENENGVIKSHRGYEDFSQYLNLVKNQQLSLKMPNFAKMISTGEACLIADISQDPHWSTLKGGEWIQGYAAIPLKIDRHVVGFLNIDSDQPNYFSEETVQSLEIFAEYASTAIKNARIYENSRQRAEEMEALVTAATAVSKSLDMMQVLQIIAEQMTKVLNVKACAISHYDPELNQVTLLTEHGPSGGKVEEKWFQPYDLAQYPPTRQVLEKNEPIHLHIDDPNLNEGERRFMEEAKVASLLMLPLVTQDRTIGLVELMDMQTGRKFSPREIDLGLSLASHAASAIENANLYRRLQEYAQELEKRVEKRTQQLQSATDYLEGILASVPDAIFVLDENQEILRTNQAGEKMRCQAKATGLDLFNPQLLKTLKDGDEPNIHSILEVQGRAYQALSSKMNYDDSQPTTKIIILRDVTHFRELDQIKTQFVSDVSHELRTPLTNLSLYLGLLTNVEDPQKQNDYMLTLQRETDRLTHLIEDLLTISRLEASRIQFQIRATDINQLVENLVCDRAFFAAQKEILLDFMPAKNLPAALADENMLTQAISNLLTNAINYTLPNGSIHVRTAYPETDWIAIEIADTGVGIPAAEIERIFDRFYRGGASQETGAEGTGLGLSISEEIIHRLNGKITLESLPGEGSTFTIWLRIASDDML